MRSGAVLAVPANRQGFTLEEGQRNTVYGAGRGPVRHPERLQVRSAHQGDQVLLGHSSTAALDLVPPHVRNRSQSGEGRDSEANR